MFNIFNIEFEYPYAFFLILLFIIANIFIKQRYSSFYISNILKTPIIFKQNIWHVFFKWSSICLLIIALTSPYKTVYEKPKKLSHTIMMLMDISFSMAGAVKIDNSFSTETKFEMIRKTGLEFVKKQKDSSIGVIVFGDFAYIATPLTYDKNSVLHIINSMQLGSAGKKTAMYDAIFLGSKMLGKNTAKEKVLILLTDGFNTSGVLGEEAVLRAVQSEKLRVYTVGIGSSKDYNEKLLNKLANENKGKFFQAQSLNSLNKIYKEIDSLEKSLQKNVSKSRKEYLYHYVLFGAFFCLLFFMYSFLRRNV